MLAHLSIANYTIVDRLDIEFHAGMTVLTGETGAGKSIMLDALGLCLGDRADPKAVRAGCERAEIIAGFDIAALAGVQRWLRDRDLDAEMECILRRVVTREGRSRAFINGKACTLQDCSLLGELLIDIHNQHEHQSLLRRDNQRRLLDAFAKQTDAARELEHCASDWLRRDRELRELTSAHDEHSARAQLLQYQVEELEQLQLQADEVGTLESDQKQLANAEQILQAAQQALDLCEQQESGSRRALQLLQDEQLFGRSLASARDLIDSAAIQLNEAHSEIQHYLAGVEIDPARLQQVENRLDKIYDIARKHRVKPEQLTEVQQQLAEELSGLVGTDARREELNSEMTALAQQYQANAKKLGRARQRAAKKLTQQVEEQLAGLAMATCRFEISLKPRDQDSLHPQGLEEIEFRISTNPGSEPQPLGKIASGGELSRISLAIQVVTASTSTVPSMVFDEVDVGIGGGVAEVVGHLLRRLSASAQIVCVTHLPQVASQGHHHLRVSKSADTEKALTDMAELGDSDKVEEIARMLGGINITEQARAHAREMLG